MLFVKNIIQYVLNM